MVGVGRTISQMKFEHFEAESWTQGAESAVCGQWMKNEQHIPDEHSRHFGSILGVQNSHREITG